MPITDLLERNSKLYGDEVALVEMNPEVTEAPKVTWKEYELIQPTADKSIPKSVPMTVSTGAALLREIDETTPKTKKERKTTQQARDVMGAPALRIRLERLTATRPLSMSFPPLLYAPARAIGSHSAEGWASGPFAPLYRTLIRFG